MTRKDYNNGLVKHDQQNNDDALVVHYPNNINDNNDVNWNGIDVDGVYHFLGRFGKYQVLQIFIACILASNLIYPILSGMFTGKMVGMKCAGQNASLGGSISTNSNQSAASLTITCSVPVIDNVTSQIVSEDACTEFEFDGKDITLSYISEWNLVCNRENMAHLPQILTMAGAAVGGITLPHVGDKFGRKRLVMFASLAMFCVVIWLPFVDQFELFLFLKFMTGLLHRGGLVAMASLILELLPQEIRTFGTLLMTVTWVIAVLFVGCVGYIFREFDWRTLQLAYGLMTLPALIGLIFVDESLRWLLENSRTKESETILRKACRMNDKDYSEFMVTLANCDKGTVELQKLVESEENSANKNDLQDCNDQATVKDIITNGNLRKMMLIMCFTWIICALTYYGLIMLSANLTGDLYLNFFLLNIVEIPSGFLVYYYMQRYGRKITLIVSNFISGLALLMAVGVDFVPVSVEVSEILQMCFTLIGKFFISGSFNIVWLYTPELFPTNLRNIAVGTPSTASSIASSCSPLLTILALKVPWAPGAIFTSGCFISVFLLTFLPETNNRQLPRTVDDVDQWFKGNDKKCTDDEKI